MKEVPSISSIYVAKFTSELKEQFSVKSKDLLFKLLAMRAHAP